MLLIIIKILQHLALMGNNETTVFSLQASDIKTLNYLDPATQTDIFISLPEEVK